MPEIAVAPVAQRLDEGFSADFTQLVGLAGFRPKLAPAVSDYQWQVLSGPAVAPDFSFFNLPAVNWAELGGNMPQLDRSPMGGMLGAGIVAGPFNELARPHALDAGVIELDTPIAASGNPIQLELPFGKKAQAPASVFALVSKDPMSALIIPEARLAA